MFRFFVFFIAGLFSGVFFCFNKTSRVFYTSLGGVKKNNEKVTYIYRSPPKKVRTYMYFLFFYFFYRVFGCFSAWGTQKQRKKNLEFVGHDPKSHPMTQKNIFLGTCSVRFRPY